MSFRFCVTESFCNNSRKWTENVTERVEDTKENTLTFVYYLNMILTPDASKALFTHVVIPEAMTRENAAALEGVFTMDIVAEAVQTENVVANKVANEAENAMEAFKTVMGN